MYTQRSVFNAFSNLLNLIFKLQQVHCNQIIRGPYDFVTLNATCNDCVVFGFAGFVVCLLNVGKPYVMGTKCPLKDGNI